MQKLQNDISKLNISNSNTNNTSGGTSNSEKLILERKNSGDEKKSNTNSNSNSLTNDQRPTIVENQQKQIKVSVNQHVSDENDEDEGGRCSIM